MSLRINLLPYNYSVEMLREGVKGLRGSILAQALETDPEAKSIDITNPVVKPEHLDAIAKMARKESLIEISNADDTSYTEAAKYLNWPLLQMAAKSSEYTDLLEFCPY